MTSVDSVAFKFIVITDTHLVGSGDKLYGLDPRARLDAAVADINTHHADARLAIVIGDLTQHGDPAAYAAFCEAMAPLAMPYVAMVGNHDRRAACLEGIPQVPRTPDGYAQGFRDEPIGRLVFLDTLDEASHAGRLCAQRLGWLARTLEETPADRALFLFMHHPPFAIGIDALDEIALRDSASLADVLRPYRERIRQLFYGHVHRPIAGSWLGIPCVALRGTNHQVELDLSPGAADVATHEPPAYGIVLVSPDAVVIHAHDYLDHSPRIPA